MSIQPITVLFDLDGTLVDTAPDLTNALNRVLANEDLPPVDAAAVRPHIGLGTRQIVAAGLYAAGVKVTEEKFLEMTADLVEFYKSNIAVESRPYQGIESVLGTLQSEGMMLGVCTNKSELLARRLLDTLDLSKFFDGVAGGDSYAVRKPDPGHALGLIEQLGGNMMRAVLIGDSEIDIMTAQAAGIPVIAVSYGYSIDPIESYSPDIVLHDTQSMDAAICALLDCGEKVQLH